MPYALIDPAVIFLVGLYVNTAIKSCYLPVEEKNTDISPRHTQVQPADSADQMPLTPRARPPGFMGAYAWVVCSRAGAVLLNFHSLSFSFFMLRNIGELSSKFIIRNK